MYWVSARFGSSAQARVAGTHQSRQSQGSCRQPESESVPTHAEYRQLKDAIRKGGVTGVPDGYPRAGGPVLCCFARGILVPANLTPDYLAAERAYKSAETHQEKIAALEEMLATLPKHKGTEKLQADLKHRLSQARRESQKKGPGHSAPAYLVKREGAGQIALAGPPNSGKSQLVCALTHARPEVAAYPFTTRMPSPGMMLFEDVQIQLIDLPPIGRDFNEIWMPQLLRTIPLTALVVDVNAPDVLGEIEFVLCTLENWRVSRPKLLAGNKIDLEGGESNFAALCELCGEGMTAVGLSAAAGVGLDAFRAAAFKTLDVVRFYSKPPGKPADLAVPYTLKRGETVQNAAARVHRDFAEHLKYARLFRKSHNHDGRMVERTHLVEDEDILEFHT